MALLGFERGISTLGQQMQFRNELDAVIAAARDNGTAQDPLIRQRLAQAEIGLQLMRFGALRMLSGNGEGALNGAGADLQDSMGHLAPHPRRTGDGRAGPSRRSDAGRTTVPCRC